MVVLESSGHRQVIFTLDRCLPRAHHFAIAFLGLTVLVYLDINVVDADVAA